MRKLAILTFMSLDGVMQGPSSAEEDMSNDFTLGGWAVPFWDDVMSQVEQEAMSTPYDLLLGRSTYDLFAASFSSADNESKDKAKDKPSDNSVANDLNKAKKYVVTSSLDTLDWNNSQPITGDVEQQISLLKQQDGLLLQVHGSWQLIQMLLSNGLIDEFRIWLFPVIVGTGKRLFDQNRLPENLTLIKTEKSASGVIMFIYQKK